MKKEIVADSAPKAPGLLSQAIEADGLLFVSGQIHKLPEGGLVGDSMEEKTKQVMANLQAILDAAGFSLEYVVKVTVFLTDMAEYANFNEVYKTYFEGMILPAREVVCVKELPLGANLEISLIAKK